MNNAAEVKSQANQSKKDGSLLVFLGALCFSGSGTIQALAPGEATPFIVGALRLLVAGLFLIAWCHGKRLFQPLKADYFKLLLSASALAGFQITFFLAVQKAGVAAGTVVTIGTTPIMAAVFGLLFYGEIPSKNWYVSTAIAIFGLVLLNLNGAETFSVNALLFPLSAGTIYAFYLSQSKDLVRESSPELVMTCLFLIASCLLIPIWFFFPCAWILSVRGITVALGLGILTTALAYCLVMTGLKNCDTAKAATLSLGEPLGAAVLGFAVLHEVLNLWSLIGITAIFASVLILVYQPGKKNI